MHWLWHAILRLCVLRTAFFSLVVTVCIPGAQAAEAAPSKTALKETLAKLAPLVEREFPNSGTVHRQMRFEYRRQPCYYVEDVDQWSTPWDQAGRSFYRYLYLVLESAAAAKLKRPPMVFEDFEKDYSQWTVEGEAFGKAPARVGQRYHHQPLRGWQGKHLADSFLNDGSPRASALQSDAAQGRLLSKPFTIQRRSIRFLIGGGAHPGRTCINLLVNGKVVRTATGQNSEQLVEHCWDVQEFEGQQAQLEIVDRHSGAWGHVMVDHIVFEDPEDYRFQVPPIGMRSAVPLGGLGAGTLELRADGSFRDWNIFNNSPAGGGGKVHLDEALLGLRIQPAGQPSRAWTLRTHPPAGLPAIGSIEYSGAFPVSRLRFRDPRLPVRVELLAYSEFRIGDAEGSATPALVMSFLLSNPLEHPVETSLLVVLPNHIQGRFSGTGGLTVSRPGKDPISGSMAVRVGDGLSVSATAQSELMEIWKQFAQRGKLAGVAPANTEARYGAMAASCSIPPQGAQVATIVLAWYFPFRPHGGQVIGNYYTNLYSSAEDVAGKVLARLEHTWEAICQWHQLCLDNSLPVWLQDALLNSLGTMLKTSFWSADGRFRQWESFSCPAVDPVHIHFYRSIPYTMFFPELQRNLFRGYASRQRTDGFIHENLGGASRPLDEAGGRMMGDCTSTFLLGVYANYLWTADRKYFDALWPAAKKAAQWQIERSAPYGLPHHLNNTYDWWNFEQKDVVAYNAVLHLAAVRAAEKMADLQGDGPFAELCRSHFSSAQKKLDELLWNGEYYRAWWMKDQPPTEAIQADTLYGQLWAFLLGLGPLVEEEKIRRHLAAEQKYNASPFGLKVMQRTGHDLKTREELVWQAGSLTWAALNLYLGSPVETSLAEAKKVINVWREHLRDPWDWRDLTTAWDGQPWCNSHYARQLIFWAIPLALSGQQYSAPERKLSFSPKLGPGAKLPWFTPAAYGTLEILSDRQIRLRTIAGRLELRQLWIGNKCVVEGVRLEPGIPFELSVR